MERALNLTALPISRTSPSLFTWDPDHNQMIAVDSPADAVYQWIDYIMVRPLASSFTNDGEMVALPVATRFPRFRN